MPRTKKRSKKVNKKSYNEAEIAVLHEIDRKVEDKMYEDNITFEKEIQKLDNAIQNIKVKLPAKYLKMTMRELAELQLAAEKSEITKADQRIKNKTVMDSNSVKPSGPFASCQLKSRRSQSAPDIVAGIKSNQPIEIIRVSRQKYRTPVTGQPRRQVLSKDRVKGIPKASALCAPVALLRYPKVGEHVVSLDGSPIIAQHVIREEANINIPIANGILSLQPSEMSENNSILLSKIDSETLKQLRTLHSNLELIMNQVHNN